ncbi:MAG: hypothetical protein AB1476_00640 [Candidatus Hadarchaeota archaeon]
MVEILLQLRGTAMLVDLVEVLETIGIAALISISIGAVLFGVVGAAPNLEPVAVAMAVVAMTLTSAGAALLFYVVSKSRSSKSAIETAIVKSILKSPLPLNPKQQIEYLNGMRAKRFRRKG